MKLFAFVFARGGSKGLPGKNVRKLGDKPLLAWSIDLAHSIKEVENVFVSTDDEVISTVARKYGATVIHRPSHLAADDSPEWLSWQHAIRWVMDKHGNFDAFLSLPATAPLRSRDSVERCIRSLSDDTDVVLTMVESARNPWFNMVATDADGMLSLVNNPRGAIVRRQDVPKTYDLTTVAYVARPAFVLQSNSMWDGQVRGVTVPPRSAVDIDTIDDFRYAEFLLGDKKE